jgi:hypothetical protein
MQSAGSNSKFYELGLQDTEPIGVGMAVLLALFAWALSRRLLRENVDKKRDAAAKIAFLVGVVGLVMSTAYFPWDAIQSLNRVTGTLVPMIQFTTRLTMIPVICLTFVAAEAADRFLRAQDKVLRYGFFVLVCGASVVFSLYQMDSVLLDRDRIIRIYSAESISGTIRTWYSGKWYWRVSGAVSAVTFVLLLASASIRYRKRRHMQV